MVGNGPVLESKHLWFPTRAAGERSFWMMLEFSLNQRPKEDQPGVAEVACATGSIDQALSLLPSIIPKDTKNKMKQLLQPWPAGRYTTAYERSGGILNLFTPPWGEAQDEVWSRMVAEWEAETFPDDQARQDAFRALEWRWNTTPHPFFAGLTPAQVMVGGGPRETELANDFLEHLTRMFDGHPFVSEGNALIKTVMLLRSWQCQRQRDGRTIFEVIVAERNQLLARRARMLARKGQPDQ